MMKLDSKFFDSIRLKRDEQRILRETAPRCAWRGCGQPAIYPAPKGRGRENEYVHFCLDHVRAYNKSYNYFDGMSDDDIVAYQKADQTGQRPTWSIGANGFSRIPRMDRQHGRHFGPDLHVGDPFRLFTEDATSPQNERRRHLGKLELRALRTLDLKSDVDPDRVKSRFKDLVKRHHPDLNGGDRSSEDRLRDIIQAYSYLKKTGLA